MLLRATYDAGAVKPCGFDRLHCVKIAAFTVWQAVSKTTLGVSLDVPLLDVNCLMRPLDPDILSIDIIAPVAASAEQSQVTVIAVALVVVVE